MHEDVSVETPADINNGQYQHFEHLLIFKLFRDSSPYSAMTDDNSTRYLKEMTLLLREQFPYSSIYPVLGDMDFTPPGQAQPKGDPMYKVAADLWDTWLPPKAIDSLKHGKSSPTCDLL